MERFLRPLNRKRNKSGDTSPPPRRGRGTRIRESGASSTSDSFATSDEGAFPTRQLSTGSNIQRTSSLPWQTERYATAEASASQSGSGILHATGAPAMAVADSASSPEPSPMADLNNMRTDVSENFKRAFQEMASENEVLRKQIEAQNAQGQSQDALQKKHDELKELLEESKAQHSKEHQRANAAVKSVSTLQTEVQTLRGTLDGKTKEVVALKAEIASSDKKSVSELMNREKAAEASMLRKTRELEALKKELRSAQEKCAEFKNTIGGLEKQVTKCETRAKNLQQSLGSEQLKRSSAERLSEARQEEVLKLRSSLSAADSKVVSSKDEIQRLTRETRALEKALDVAKGDGDGAASRISDLERSLSLRTDELKNTESLLRSAENKRIEAESKLTQTIKDLRFSREETLALKEGQGSAVKNIEAQFSEDKARLEKSVANLNAELEKQKNMYSVEVESVRKTLEDQVKTLMEKNHNAKEELASSKLEWGHERRDLQLRMDQLQESVSAKDRENRSLAGQVGDAKASEEDVKWHLERSNKKLTDAREAMEMADREHKEEVKHMRERINLIQLAYRDAERKSSDLELSLNDAKESNERLTDRLNRAVASAKEWESKAETAASSVKDNESAMSNFRELEDQLKSLSSELADKNNSLYDLKLKLNEAQEKLSQVSMEKDELRKAAEKVRDTKFQADQLEANLANVTEENSSLVERFEAVSAEARKTKASLSSLTNQYEEVEKERDALQKNLDDAESSRAELQSKLSGNIQQTDELEEKIVDLHHQLEERKGHSSNRELTLEKEIKMLGERVREVNAARDKDREEIEILIGDKEELAKTVQAMERSREENGTAQHAEVRVLRESKERIEKERDDLMKQIDENSALIARLSNDVESANEQALNVAKEMADTQQIADEAQARAAESEEELARLSEEMQRLEWNLNEESLRAENAEATVASLREQGRSIYSRIEEFGEEAEARVLAAENELEGRLEELRELQARIGEYEDELDESRKLVKQLRAELGEIQSNQSTLVLGKEAAERRLQMAKQETDFNLSRVTKLESDHKSLMDELESTRSTFRDLEHSSRRTEAENEAMNERLRLANAELDRLRGVESDYKSSELETLKLKALADQAVAAQTRLELERNESLQRLRETERSHAEEKMQLMAERTSFAETARKAQYDLGARQEELDLMRSAVSSTGSGRRDSEMSQVKNHLGMGLSAVIGGAGVFALKLLTKPKPRT